MPLISLDESQERAIGFRGTLPDMVEAEKGENQTFNAGLDAALRLENPVFSYITNRQYDLPSLFQQPSDFDPFDQIEGYETYANRFTRANNPVEVEGIKAKIDQENEDRETLANMGWQGTALAMGAGVLDPINLIPVGGTAYKSYRVGRNILDGAYVTARAGLLSSTASEAALQSTQQTRTLGESGMNIAAGTLLGGLLGGAAGGFRRIDPVHAELEKRLYDDMNLPGMDEVDPLAPGAFEIDPDAMSSVGAAQVYDNITLEDLTPSGTFGIGETLAKGPVIGKDKSAFDFFNTPDMRILYNSNSREAKLTLLDLAETPLRLKGNQDGKFVNPVPVQREIDRWKFARSNVHNYLDDQYILYRTGNKRKALDVGKAQLADVTGRTKSGILTYADFSREVSRSLRNGDVHDNPFIESVAQAYRKNIFMPAAEELKKLGRLPDEFDSPEGALSYLSRVYDRDAIRKNPNAFIDRIAGWIRGERSKEGDALDDIEIRAVATGIKDRILNLPEGRNAYDEVFDIGSKKGGAGAASSLKSRKLTFADEVVEDFLINDIEHVTDLYVRSVIPDIEFAKRFGTIDDNEILSKVTDDYNKQIAAADQKTAAKLQKEVEAVTRDLRVIIDRLRNNFARHPGFASANTGLSALKSYNIMRLMGGITISSIPDVARIGLANASAPIFRDAIKGLTKAPVRQLMKNEAQMLNTALDITLEGRAHAIMDIADDLGRSNKLGNMARSGATNYMHLTGITKWNEMWETVVGNIATTRIYQAGKKAAHGRLTPEEKAMLAESGIDIPTAARIGRLVEKHGFKEGNLEFADLKKWDLRDPAVFDAYNKLQSAVSRDVERIIINPGQDKPIWLSTPLGSTIGQFKTFGYASLQRSTLLYAQRLSANPKDFAAITALTTQIALGMAVTYLKLAMVGKAYETTKDWTPVKWVAEGIDRSGVLGAIMDMNNALERISGNHLGLSPLTGGGPMTRYARRNTLDAMLGPTAGIASDVIDTTAAVAGAPSGDITQADIRAMRRLLPMQNYVFFKNLFDLGEDKIIEAFDIPKTAPDKKGNKTTR